MSKRIEIVLKPEQSELQDTINERIGDVQHLPDRSGGTTIILSVPSSAADVLDELGIEYDKGIPPGRPSRYPDRKRSSLEMSPEVWEEIDRQRGEESRAVFIEQAVRQCLGMPALELLK